MCPIEHNPQESMLTYWKDVEWQKRPIFFFTLYGKHMYEKTIEQQKKKRKMTHNDDFFLYLMYG